MSAVCLENCPQHLVESDDETSLRCYHADSGSYGNIFGVKRRASGSDLIDDPE